MLRSPFALQVICFFNYIDRVAEGLGVDPEDWMKPTPSEWRQRKAKEYEPTQNKRPPRS